MTVKKNEKARETGERENEIWPTSQRPNLLQGKPDGSDGLHKLIEKMLIFNLNIILI